MSTYHIRLYKACDYHTVREIFTIGCFEHTAAAFFHASRLPHNCVALLVGFLLPLLTTRSLILSIICVLSVMVLLWFSIRELISSCVKRALAEDLKDIDGYYMRRGSHCFWVAESAGEVVGTVAAVPLEVLGGEKIVELKRMSVASTHRGKGIAKMLCRTLIDFAQKKRYNAVILSTTSVQVDAVRLYEKMGFWHVDSSYQGSFINGLLGFIWVTYRYDLSTNK
ncbi:hypothetical protein GDO81_022725 [Engystomops pustulosus]|uniref:N-acetyltransferase domain-containing protein n=1 Tax=Engystomops pustulosus TaxID=76066 RepID=A0AAV6ZEL7_ENGPU|nr:hypothetical protein GDO81_022725 [Engystomops pustulosus]